MLLDTGPGLVNRARSGGSIVHVQADADHRQRRVLRTTAGFEQDAAQLATAKQQIVGPFQPHPGQPMATQGLGHQHPHGQTQARHRRNPALEATGQRQVHMLRQR